MKPRELTVAEKAKSVLLERGWRQGACSGGSVSVCLVIALEHATLARTDYNAVDRAVEAMGFENAYDAMVWNDDPDRTVEEVLERMDRI